MRLLLPGLLLALALGEGAFAASQKEGSCKPQMAQIMILGTYHMGNPGQDRYNMKADDVLARLQRFRPTKIAIEGQYNQTNWSSKYAAYLAGNYQLGRNEIEQLGFKLAKRLNHTAIYPVDYQMWMDGRVPAEIASPLKAPKQASPVPTQSEPPPAWIVERETVLTKSTVLEYLRFLNSEDAKRPDQASYLDMLLPDETDAPYGQADQVANWYKRNLRIFTNINRIADFPSDRILLLIGSGHETILSDFARQSSYFCLVDVEDYLQ